MPTWPKYGQNLENKFNLQNPAVHFLTSRQFEHHPEAVNSVLTKSPLPAIA
jgi:hypothetical protein